VTALLHQAVALAVNASERIKHFSQDQDPHDSAIKSGTIQHFFPLGFGLIGNQPQPNFLYNAFANS